jgi:acetyl esterase/lipase
LAQLAVTIASNHTEVTLANPESFELRKDIPYLGNDRAEKMDIYLPDDSFPRPRPAVILIHGGGWRIGDKADTRERNIATTLASHGFAAFSINYLLNEFEVVDGKVRTLKSAWPVNFWDCKSAVRFVRKNAAEFGIDPARIGVLGGSAGGSFALLLGATGNVPELNREGLYTDQSAEVACVVDFYGVIDMHGRELTAVSADTPEKTAENARMASVINWLHPQMPPVLIAHGTADKLVSVDVSRDLAKRLESLGVNYWYVEIAGAPHSFHLQPQQMDLSGIVLQFFHRWLGNASPAAAK